MRRIWRHRAAISTGIGIGLLLALVTLLAYLDGGSAGSFIHFYYIPIVLASYILGDLGGIVAAFAAASSPPCSRSRAALPSRSRTSSSEVSSSTSSAL